MKKKLFVEINWFDQYGLAIVYDHDLKELSFLIGFIAAHFRIVPEQLDDNFTGI